jgi:hypothetical protein
MAVKFHNDGDVTIDKIKVEFSNILDLATKKKCKSVMIRKNDMIPWVVFVSKDRVYGEKYFDYLIEQFKRLEGEETIKGDFIGYNYSYDHIPAKYVSKTYVNGRLHDTYEHDWAHGYFKSSTSTHRFSDGDIYRTETYYQPPRSIEKKTEGYEYKTFKFTSLERFVSTICF